MAGLWMGVEVCCGEPMLLGVFTWLWGLGLAVERSGVLMSGRMMADWVEVDGHCGGLLSAYGFGCGEPLVSGVFTGLWVLGLTVVRLGVLMFGQENSKVLQLMADGVEMVGHWGALLSALSWIIGCICCRCSWSVAG